VCAAIGDSACGTHTLKVEERTKFDVYDETSTFLKMKEMLQPLFQLVGKKVHASWDQATTGLCLPSKEKNIGKKKRWRTNLILLLKNHFFVVVT